MRAPAWWNQLIELNRRASDERTREIQTAAAKDAFIAVTVALMITSVVAIALPEGSQRLALAVLPIVLLAVGGTTFLISFRLRGGGYEARLANAKIGVIAAASIVGFGLALLLLQRSGAALSATELLGQGLGAALALAIIYVVIVRSR